MKMQDIINANRDAGRNWFDAGAMAFFASKIEGEPVCGPGGVYFVTSEQFVGSRQSSTRRYTVRQFVPETAAVETIGPFNKIRDKSDAFKMARFMAKPSKTFDIPLVDIKLVACRHKTVAGVQLWAFSCDGMTADEIQEQADEACEALKTMGWTEQPSAERFNDRSQTGKSTFTGWLPPQSRG